MEKDSDRKTVKLSTETWLQMNGRDLTKYATADDYIRHLMELEKIYDNPKVSTSTWEEAIIMSAKSIASMQQDISRMNEKLDQIILMMDRESKDDVADVDEKKPGKAAVKEDTGDTAEDLDDEDIPDLTDDSVPDPYARWR